MLLLGRNSFKKKGTHSNKKLSYSLNGSLVDWITQLLTNSSKLYIVMNNSLIVR